MYGVESIWTELRITALKELWASGAPASQIAAELGEVSRNSVIGKAHRLKLAKRVMVRLPRVERQLQKPRVQRFREVLPMPEQHDRHYVEWLEQLHFKLFPINSSGPECTLMELTNHTCRFPLWTDEKPEQMFCGAPGADLENKLPYCPRHSRMAYRPRRCA